MRNPDRAVDKADDLRADRWLAVGIKDAVDAEISVVLPLAVVAAVGEAAVGMAHRVIDHLPDAAAHEIVVGVDFLPVGLGIAGTDTHRVRVLAKEVRPVIERRLLAAVLADLMYILHARVHLAADIIGDALAVHRTLVVHRQCGVRLQIVVHRVGIRIAAGLVAERPHDNGRIGVKLIALIEPRDAVEIARLPLGIVADGVVGRRDLMRPGAVRLQIVFVDDIDPVFVGQLQKQRVRRIVRGADRIDIELLAELHIPLDLVGGHRIAVRRAGIVVVDTFELDLSAVEQEHVAADLHGFKADALADAGRRGLIVNRIECRLLGAPLGNGEVFKAHRRALPCGRDCLRLVQAVPLQREGHIGIGECRGRQRQRIGLPHLFRDGIQILKIGRFGDAQQHIAENAVVAEHVLALEIGAGAPAVHDGHELVLPLVQQAAQIELRNVVRALGIADKGSVQIEVEAARHAQERDHIVLARVRDRQTAPIHADEIILVRVFPARRDRLIHAHPGKHRADPLGRRDHRGLERKLIADIDIEGPIIAAKLPAGRYVDLVKSDHVRIQDLRQLSRTGIEMKIPLPVQADDFFGCIAFFLGRNAVRRCAIRIGHKVAAAGKLVFLIHAEIMIIALIQDIFHVL